MIKLILTSVAVLALAGCGTLHTTAGNGGHPFGTAHDTYQWGDVYEANSRAELIEWCHDNHGYISEDGLNCVWSVSPWNWYTSTPHCVKAFVKDRPHDDEWTTAVCGGDWKPKLEIG